MAYLFVTLYVTFFLYFTRCISRPYVLWIVPFLLCFIVSSLQYDVGSDYMSYKFFYQTGAGIDRFYNSNEFLFYYVYKFLIAIQAGEQSIFVFSSLFNTSLLFLILRKLHHHGLKIWLVFFLFMTITGMYQNQLNGLRNFAAIYLFLLTFIYIFERKYLVSMILILTGLVTHASFALMLPFFILTKLKVNLNKFFLIAFFSIFFFVFFAPLFIEKAIELLAPGYVSVFSRLSDESLSFTAIISKLLYVPVYILLLFKFCRLRDEKYSNDNILYLFIFSFFISFGLLLLSFEMKIVGRLYQYFSFFTIFPMYYCLTSMSNKTKLITISIFLGLLVVFSLKVTVFSAGEYDYEMIRLI